MTIRIYGIPTCNSCKKAMKWLDEQGLSYEWHNHRDEAPKREKISLWIDALGTKPLRNTSGKSYRALGPERDSWGNEEWLEAFSEDAMLLKRPLLEVDDVAKTTGFKEDSWGKLLSP